MAINARGNGGANRVHGREDELALVDSVIRRLIAGSGSFVAWLGEPGIGASSLLRAATDRVVAGVEDVHCISVSARGVKGGPLASIGFVIDQILPLVPQARSAALDRLLRPDADEDPDPGELLRAAAQVVRAASKDRPLLITIEDARIAEDGNWAAVSAAAAQLAPARAAVFLTSGYHGAAGAPATALGPLWVQRLSGLGPDAVALVVQETVPHFVPRAVATRLGRLLGGNPAAIKDACAQLGRDELLGLTPLPDPLPAERSSLTKYQEWLHGLDAPERRLLLAAALAVRPTPATLEAVAGTEITDLDGLYSSPWATVRGDSVEMVDPRLRSVVLKSATHRQIKDTHAALADATTDEVAAVLHRSASGASIDAAGTALLTAAAEKALGTGDNEGALQAARPVLAAARPGPERARVALTAGIAAYQETYAGLAATLLHQALNESDDAAIRHRALTALCLSVAARDGSAPYALVDEALEPLATTQPAAAAALACLIARIAQDSSQAELARTYLTKAETLAARSRSAPAQQGKDPASERLNTDLEHTRAWLDIAPAASRSLRQLPTVAATRPQEDLTGWDLVVRQVALLTRAEDWQQARFALAEVEHRQGGASSRMVAAATAVAALELHLAVGAVQDAQDVVAQAGDDLPLRMPFAGVGLCLVARTLILRGQTDRAQDWLERARRFAQSTGSPAVLVRIPAEQALLARIEGDAEAAVRLLEVAVQRASHLRHDAFAELQLDLLEARQEAGVETRTDEVMPVLEFAWGNSNATGTERAMLAAARLLAAPRDRLVAAALAAVDSAEWQESGLWAARITHLAGNLLGALSPDEHAEQVRRLAVSDLPKNRDEHRRSLYRRAAAQFTECGADALADVVASRLQRLEQTEQDDSAPRAPLLTPDEQRVAAMVAGGASNRQVASTTYVSVRTVELRLTSIYRKLGIRSRKELSDALRGNGMTVVQKRASGSGDGSGAAPTDR